MIYNEIIMNIKIDRINQILELLGIYRHYQFFGDFEEPLPETFECKGLG